MKQINVRVTKEEDRLIKIKSERNNSSISNTLREGLLQDLIVLNDKEKEEMIDLYGRKEFKKDIEKANKTFETKLLRALKEREGKDGQMFTVTEIIEKIKFKTPRYSYLKDIEIDTIMCDIRFDSLTGNVEAIPVE